MMHRALRHTSLRHTSLRQSTVRMCSSSAHDRQKQVIGNLVMDIGDAAKRVVPWFLDTMPSAYFRQVAPARREAHLRAITAFSTQGIRVPEVQLRDTSGKGFTFIKAHDQGDMEHGCSLNEVVLRQLEALPADLGLRRVLIFQSTDGRLGLNVFDTIAPGDATESRRFGAPGADATELASEAAAVDFIREYASRRADGSPFAASESQNEASELLASHGLRHSGCADLSLDDFLARCPSSYVLGHASTAWLLHRQKRMYGAVAGGDDMAVMLDRYDGPLLPEGESGSGQMLLTLAIPKATARKAIHRTLLLLNLHQMEMQRAQVDTIADGDDDVVLLRTVVRPLERTLTPDDCNALVHDASRLKWVSDWSFSLANSSSGGLTLLEAEVALGLGDLSLALLDHPLLSRQDVRERLHTADVQDIAAKLAKAFLARFDPDTNRTMNESAYTDALDGMLKDIETGPVSDEQSKQLLRAMASASRHTLRTNVHLDDRWALSMRLDPAFFQPILPPVAPGFCNVPHGTFFVAGRHFNGYHNRFRDIARGGLRVVLPPSLEAHAAESRRHFMECFGLSWAQQLKNKDIPEGGAKAVCLVTPQPGENRSELMHGCVKRMADAMLDLLVPSTADQLVTRRHVDGTPLGSELVYLGPDENITPHDLDWIVERAGKRGYAMPSAFMSSKPRAGINHKEYGVTSEGVAVFLGEALRAIGISPTEQPWTVKLTGGPDGDVAGNMLKILDRDYGKQVRVVGMADGTASAEDPDGLPMEELLRLFQDSLPLGALDKSKLGARGFLTIADTPAGIAARNTLHNRVLADAFVPAGGRPATMNGSNWRDFLQPDGTPSAKVVVEGANLFLTPEARLALFEETGLPIVKDSSANKCGVICSSMEIRASMCVSDDEFVEIKSKYVDEVLARLRHMAQLEATLLFSEASRDASTPLPALSERISFAILRVADALASLLDAHARDHQLWPVVGAQLPPALASSEHAAKLPERLPWEYQKSTIAKSLASRLVYREGLSFVETMPEARLPVFALAYLQEEQRVGRLAAQVAGSGHAFSSEVEALLLQGGVRVAAERAANARGYDMHEM